MRFVLFIVAALFPASSWGADDCERIFLSDDRTVAVTVADAGYILNGQAYGARGCGSGLMCATDFETDEFVPFLLTIQAPYSGSPTVTINHRHPDRGDMLLKPYCITPQPAE